MGRGSGLIMNYLIAIIETIGVAILGLLGIVFLIMYYLVMFPVVFLYLFFIKRVSRGKG